MENFGAPLQGEREELKIFLSMYLIYLCIYLSNYIYTYTAIKITIFSKMSTYFPSNDKGVNFRDLFSVLVKCNEM